MKAPAHLTAQHVALCERRKTLLAEAVRASEVGAVAESVLDELAQLEARIGVLVELLLVHEHRGGR